VTHPAIHYALSHWVFAACGHHILRKGMFLEKQRTAPLKTTEDKDKVTCKNCLKSHWMAVAKDG
jgi:hypothetical protein